MTNSALDVNKYAGTFEEGERAYRRALAINLELLGEMARFGFGFGFGFKEVLQFLMIFGVTVFDQRFHCRLADSRISSALFVGIARTFQNAAASFLPV